MSKHNVIIDCSCGMNCSRTMTLSEDEENSKLVSMSVKKNDDILPEFFELDRSAALEVAKFLITKFKLREELNGSGKK